MYPRLFYQLLDMAGPVELNPAPLQERIATMSRNCQASFREECNSSFTDESDTSLCARVGDNTTDITIGIPILFIARAAYTGEYRWTIVTC